MTPQVGDIWAHRDWPDEYHLLVEDITDADYTVRGRLAFKTISIDSGEQDEVYFKVANFAGWRKVA